jgi:hypothetical protein
MGIKWDDQAKEQFFKMVVLDGFSVENNSNGWIALKKDGLTYAFNEQITFRDLLKAEVWFELKKETTVRK